VRTSTVDVAFTFAFAVELSSDWLAFVVGPSFAFKLIVPAFELAFACQIIVTSRLQVRHSFPQVLCQHRFI
jgi:hypothetical protein